MKLPIFDIVAAMCCLLLLVDSWKEPEKFGLNRGFQKVFFLVGCVFICTVFYEMMAMPFQGIVAHVRLVTSAAISVMSTYVLKKHKKDLTEEVNRKWLLVALFGTGVAVSIIF